MQTPNISTGKKIEPFLGILHGPHGIGKTVFGSKMPNPIFITGEETGEYNLARYDKCNNWNEFIACLVHLRDNQHDYKSLVIDTIDSIESILHKKILQDDGGKASMAVACGGYGKAYEKAMNLFIDVRDNYLSPLRAKGMNILILAHSAKNKVEDPLTQSSYDKYELKLHKTAKGIGTYPVFAEWVSCILFANFEVYRTDDEKYAIGEGRRLMFSEPRPAFDAKNRFSLPYQMNLEWSEVSEGLKKHYGITGSPKTEIQEGFKVGLIHPSVESENSSAIHMDSVPEGNGKATLTDGEQKALIVKMNISELLGKVTDNNLANMVKQAVENAGDNLTELGRIQGKLIKAV